MLFIIGNYNILLRVQEQLFKFKSNILQSYYDKKGKEVRLG